jgi:hypothetical protein
VLARPATARHPRHWTDASARNGVRVCGRPEPVGWQPTSRSSRLRDRKPRSRRHADVDFGGARRTGGFGQIDRRAELPSQTDWWSDSKARREAPRRRRASWSAISCRAIFGEPV